MVTMEIILAELVPAEHKLEVIIGFLAIMWFVTFILLQIRIYSQKQLKSKIKHLERLLGVSEQ